VLPSIQRVCLLVTCLLFCCANLSAQEKKLKLTVAAGKATRENTPVSVLVSVPAALVKGQVTLTDTAGNLIPAQLTQPSLHSELAASAQESTVQIHFVLPKLSANESTTLQAVIKPNAASESAFKWIDTSAEKGEKDVHAEQSRELQLSGRPIMRYMHTKLDESNKEARMGTYKPYHHVYDPAGKRYLTKGPGGVFPHHRGLYFGFNKISYNGKSADTWHCNKGEDESHTEFAAEETGAVLGRHRLTINWNGQAKDTFAVETREMTAYNVPGGTLIEFATLLKSKVGTIKLDGDPQHAGFQFRATQDVPDKTAKQTYYLRPDGKGTPGQFRNWPADKSHANLPWNALSIVVDDQRYTVCYLDRAENPKEARFSERDYGRFGSYFEYELTPEKPLKLNYRIWLQAGEMEVSQVQRLATDFTEPVSVTVE
jgi:Methane oxygenase PmoA